MIPLLPAWILAVPVVAAVVERVRTPRPVYSTARSSLLPQTPVSPAIPGSFATLTSGEDLVSYLKLQHKEIEALFAETLATHGAAREARFLALRRLLAAHEATEEELLHPVAERALGEDGNAIVVARLEEERAAATTLTSIEDLRLDTLQFEMSLRKLQGEVLKHATREEREEFPALAGMQSDRFPRVHAVAEVLYANAAWEGVHLSRDIGPFVSMLNCARDILAGKLAHETAAIGSREAAE